MNDTITYLDRLREKAGSDDVGVWQSYGKGATVKEHPDGGRELRLVMTTDGVDLDGDIVDPAGADWSYWEKTGLPVYLDHQYSFDMVVGHGRRGTLKMQPMGGGLSGWTVTAGLLKSERGDAIMAVAREMGQIGCSIGFQAQDSRAPSTEEAKRVGVAGTKARRCITKWMGIELSLTAMPCNPMAGGSLSPEAKRVINELDRLVTKGIISKSAAYSLGLPAPTKLASTSKRIVRYVR